jgi:hypothetical protein
MQGHSDPLPKKPMNPLIKFQRVNALVKRLAKTPLNGEIVKDSAGINRRYKRRPTPAPQRLYGRGEMVVHPAKHASLSRNERAKR